VGGVGPCRRDADRCRPVRAPRGATGATAPHTAAGAHLVLRQPRRGAHPRPGPGADLTGRVEARAVSRHAGQAVGERARHSGAEGGSRALRRSVERPAPGAPPGRRHPAASARSAPVDAAAERAGRCRCGPGRGPGPGAARHRPRAPPAPPPGRSRGRGHRLDRRGRAGSAPAPAPAPSPAGPARAPGPVQRADPAGLAGRRARVPRRRRAHRLPPGQARRGRSAGHLGRHPPRGLAPAHGAQAHGPGARGSAAHRRDRGALGSGGHPGGGRPAAPRPPVDLARSARHGRGQPPGLPAGQGRQRPGHPPRLPASPGQHEPVHHLVRAHPCEPAPGPAHPTAGRPASAPRDPGEPDGPFAPPRD